MDVINKHLVVWEPTHPCAEGMWELEDGETIAPWLSHPHHSDGPMGTGELEFSSQTMSHLTTQFFRHPIHSQGPCSWKKRERQSFCFQSPNPQLMRGPTARINVPSLNYSPVSTRSLLFQFLIQLHKHLKLLL